ncbi:MAG: mucoidy inhibitor MuiA family protein, partial [Bacteroidia bacterium]|nr:mucoidy inhibitor MuiA family protein [Bacteroidia bacterium]
MKTITKITRQVILTCITLLLFSIPSFASVDTVEVDSKISDVTVYLRGAQINRTAVFNLTEGRQVLSLTNITTLLDPSSIKVKSPANCEVLSVKFIEKSLDEKLDTDESERIEDEIDELKFEIKKKRMELSVYAEEKTLLVLNNDFTSDGATKIEELEKATAFYRQKLTEINGKTILIEQELDNLKEEIVELRKDINDLKQSKIQLPGNLLVTVKCLRAGSSRLAFTYYSAAAGWEPVYDFRVADVSRPLQIVYKANVFQSTNEDWEDVNIVLSSTNPKMNNDKPNFSTWYLSRLNRSAPVRQVAYTGDGAIKGMVTDMKSGEPVPFANVIAEISGELKGGAQTDFDGNYTIKPLDPGLYVVRSSFVGKQPSQVNGVRVSKDRITLQDIKMKEGNVDLAAIEITDYSIPLIDKGSASVQQTWTSEDLNNAPKRSINNLSSTAAGVYHSDESSAMNVRGGRDYAGNYYIDGIKVRGSQNDPSGEYLAKVLKSIEKEKKLGLDYIIDEPYTILADGKNYLLEIKRQDQEVNYTYHAIPKLDKEVFLVAEFTNWRELDLLSGDLNIFYDNTYLGKSKILAEQIIDTLELSVARDRDIQVKRE